MNLNELKAQAAAGTLIGAFQNIPNEVYHGITNYLSATQIGAWLKSERHYEALLTDQMFDSAALEFGRLVHLAVGEIELFGATVVTGPDVSRNSKEWKAFEAANPGKSCLKPAEIQDVMKLANRVHAHPKVGGMFSNALVEWSFFGICPVTGHPVKCRPDLLSRDYLFLGDLKSTKSAHPDEFPRQAYNLNYHVKMAHYMDVIQIVTGVRPELGVFIAAESSPPYEVVPFVPDRDEEFGIDPLEVGAKKAREVRADIALRLAEKRQCEVDGKPFRWRGYSEDFVPMHLPRHVCKAIVEAEGAVV